MTVNAAVLNRKLREGDAVGVRQAVRRSLASGASAETLLREGLLDAMAAVGEEFRRHRIYVPEVLVAARALRAGIEALRPALGEGPEDAGTLVLGTVRGDLHALGKDLVGLWAQGAGFRVVDVGVDQPAARFVRAAREHGADLVGLSALLTGPLAAVEETIVALRRDGPPGLRVCVGGAAVDAAFAGRIGADGWAPDAPAAVELFRSLVSRRRRAEP
jgi:5-methyltetrahydrofolate--homocysteine methyltransferase